jgi:hypothetical protein
LFVVSFGCSQSWKEDWWKGTIGRGAMLNCAGRKTVSSQNQKLTYLQGTICIQNPPTVSSTTQIIPSTQLFHADLRLQQIQHDYFGIVKHFKWGAWPTRVLSTTIIKGPAGGGKRRTTWTRKCNCRIEAMEGAT